MKLFEVKDDMITINLDTEILKEYAPKLRKSKIDYGDPVQELIDKAKNGNQDAIIKTIGILKKAFVKTGSITYDQLRKRSIK